MSRLVVFCISTLAWLAGDYFFGSVGKSTSAAIIASGFALFSHWVSCWIMSHER